MGKKTKEDVKQSIEEYLIRNGPKYSREILDFLTRNEMIGTHIKMSGKRIGGMLKQDKRFRETGKIRNHILWSVNQDG